MTISTVPCAIYTRKSSEEGLEQDFNSLAAQREACEAYVLSQKALGWRAVPVRYDDGGFSGGTLDRPAVQQLLRDVAAHRVKVIVVYKVDRLTRSLTDFAKLVELLDAHGVSFVSVTQQFNTTSSMGRLTLNVLLSFAQFEREVTGERIRDKIAASKAKGMWMGGNPPVGYRPHERTLVIDPLQAERIRTIFERYLALGTVRGLQAELASLDWVTPPRTTRRARSAGGRPFSRGHLYRILSNPVYVGKIRHKSTVHAGKHPAIIEPALWAAVQETLARNQGERRVRAAASDPSLLAGLVFDANGDRLTPTHATKGPRRYRYYVSHALHEDASRAVPEAIRVPAPQLERTVIDALKGFLQDDLRMTTALGEASIEGIRAVLRAAHRYATQLSGQPGRAVLIGLLQQRIERVIVAATSLTLEIKLDGLIDVERSKATELPSVTITVPVALKRWGMAMRLIARGPHDLHPQEADPTLVALIAKANRWFEQLASGTTPGLAEIATAEGVSSAYISRVLHLAFLAPDIVACIVRGDQPSSLNAQRLMRALPLPIDWAAQRDALGFAASR